MDLWGIYKIYRSAPGGRGSAQVCAREESASSQHVGTSVPMAGGWLVS